MLEVHGQDLGVSGCSYTASGETPGEVLKDMLSHLRQEHDLDMPPAEKLLEGEAEPGGIPDLGIIQPKSSGATQGGVVAHIEQPPDEGVQLITRRLMERLNLTE